MAYKVAYEGAGGGETLAGEFRCLNRADFEAFTDRLFIETECLWPSEQTTGAEDGAAAESPARPVAPAARASADTRPSAKADLPPLGFSAALHSLRGPERRAKMLEIKERGYTARQVGVAFGSSQGAVEMAISTARKERAGGAS